MKLLGWMHHKLCLRKIEPFKELSIGNYCNCLSVHSSLNDRDSHPKSTLGYGYSSRYSSLSQQETEDSITGFEGGEEDNFGDEAYTVISGRFQGFLTIGTLGSQRIIDEPATPTFTTSSDNMTKERLEVTENDLKFINDKLGRFLEAQAEEQGSNQTSGRNSLVSTITLSGKPIQEANAEEYGETIISPLEGYLFGSLDELSDTRFEVKKEKALLAELFNNTKIAEENHVEKCGNEEIQAKQTYKPVKHLIKKILKKVHASSGSSSTSPKETRSFSSSTKIKLQKVIKLFHRKIHPENSIAERESNASNSDDNYIDGDQIQQAKHNMRMRLPQGSMSKEGLENKKIISKLPSYGITGYHAASENGEHWINTDADYLVLELQAKKTATNAY